MIELDLFHRAERKRLRYDLREKSNQAQELEREVTFLRGVRTAQGAVIEMLQEQLRAEQELNRHLQHENKKLWDMYRASEAMRQKMAEREREQGAREDAG